MINIKPVMQENEYENIFFNKNGLGTVYKILEDDIQIIKQRIDLYDFTSNQLERLSELYLPSEVADKLKGLYDLQNPTIELLKAKIKEHHIYQDQTDEGMTCVYCGIMRCEAEDLDHYLPRSLFPEFSILAQNLIFVCKTCNQTFKKSLFLDDDDIRYILNPYFDKYDGIELLKCEIDSKDIRNLSVKYSINIDIEKQHTSLYDIACNHFKTLDLNKRYSRTINTDCWDGFKESFSDDTEFGLKFKDNYEGFIKYIKNKISRHKKRPNNNFEKLFWETLLSEKKMLEFLPGQILPRSVEEWYLSHKCILGIDDSKEKYGDKSWTKKTYLKLCLGEQIDLFDGPLGLNAIESMLNLITEVNSSKITNAFESLEKSINFCQSDNRPYIILKKLVEDYKKTIEQP